MCGVQNL